MNKFLILAMTLIVSACASVPDVKVTYFHAQGAATATVVQTIACNPQKTNMIIRNTATILSTYSSDPAKFKEIHIKKLDRYVADVDLTVALFDDGRLKSINQSTTGRGEEVVKAIGTFMAAVAMLDLSLSPTPECEFVEKWGGGKPIALTYRSSFNLKNPGVPKFTATDESEFPYTELGKLVTLPALTVSVGALNQFVAGPRLVPAKVPDDAVPLELQEMQAREITVKADNHEIGKVQVLVPGDNSYSLPIPKAALFGKQTFGLTLADTGAVVSVSYGSASGSAGAINALGSIVGTQTDATKAGTAKAEADLIAQEQRLMLCRAKPAECK